MSASRIATPVLSAVVLAGLLTGCWPGSPLPTPDAGDPSVTTVPVETTTPDPGESETPAPEPEPAFSDDDRANLQDAITSGNTAAIEGYLSDPVRVIIMSSECCFDISPSEAVGQLDYVTGATGTWNFLLPSSVTDDWHDNEYYGYLFTGDDVTGLNSDGTVVSFGIVGDEVTTILMGFEEGFTY